MSEEKSDPYLTRRTLIERVSDQHDESAWEKFAQVYNRYIYAVIRNMNISAHDAEEIHQQVMIKLWKHLPELDIDQLRRFRSYLGTITKNEVLQFIRSRQRRIVREEKAAGDASLDYLNKIRVPDVEEIIEAEWRIHLTNIALRNIENLFTENAMTIFRLSIDGLHASEIVQKTGMTLSTVNTLKSRVRSRFTAELEQLKQELE